MDSKGKLLVFMFAVVFLISLVMLPAMRVKADSSEPIAFSSGLTLYSPVNTTYSSNVVECNGTFNDPRDFESSLNYSVDGNYQGSLPWTLNQNSINNPVTYILDWSFQLPQLPKGSHQLSIGIEIDLFNGAGALINRTTWVNGVYFIISSSPSSTPAMMIVNEQVLIIALIAVVIALSIGLLLYRRHRKTLIDLFSRVGVPSNLNQKLNEYLNKPQTKKATQNNPRKICVIFHRMTMPPIRDVEGSIGDNKGHGESFLVERSRKGSNAVVRSR